MSDGPDGRRHPPDPTAGRRPRPAAKKQRPLPPVLSKAPPAALVIFGASGDLTARKILPPWPGWPTAACSTTASP